METQARVEMFWLLGGERAEEDGVAASGTQAVGEGL